MTTTGTPAPIFIVLDPTRRPKQNSSMAPVRLAGQDGRGPGRAFHAERRLHLGQGGVEDEERNSHQCEEQHEHPQRGEQVRADLARRRRAFLGEALFLRLRPRSGGLPPLPRSRVRSGRFPSLPSSTALARRLRHDRIVNGGTEGLDETDWDDPFRHSGRQRTEELDVVVRSFRVEPERTTAVSTRACDRRLRISRTCRALPDGPAHLSRGA